MHYNDNDYWHKCYYELEILIQRRGIMPHDQWRYRVYGPTRPNQVFWRKEKLQKSQEETSEKIGWSKIKSEEVDIMEKKYHLIQIICIILIILIVYFIFQFNFKEIFFMVLLLFIIKCLGEILYETKSYRNHTC